MAREISNWQRALNVQQNIIQQHNETSDKLVRMIGQVGLAISSAILAKKEPEPVCGAHSPWQIHEHIYQSYTCQMPVDHGGDVHHGSGVSWAVTPPPVDPHPDEQADHGGWEDH